MRVLDHTVDGEAVVITTSVGRLRLQAIGDRVMRVVYTGRPTFSDQSLASNGMLLGGLERSAPAVAEADGILVLSTPRLRLEIDRATGAFSWADETGRLLVREPHDRRDAKLLEEVDVLRTVFSDDTDITTVRGADGERAVVTGTETVVDRQAYSTTLRLEFQDDEAIYGLGQHEDGILNYRGHHEYLYQQNMKIVAPMIVSTRGYGILWDSQSLASFHDDQHGTYFWTETDDELDFLFIVGPELDDIVGEVRRLTGEAPMLPRWALGYVQSKDRYVDAAELIEVVSQFRARDLPIDCIVQDWQSWPEGQWGQKSLDPNRFPDPKGLVDQLHGMDCRLMVSIWPNMHGNGANQREFREHGQLLGDGSTYDAFDPAARERYAAQVSEGYAQHGVDAFWSDCTEPFEADWKGAVRPQPGQRVVINTDAMKKYLDPERINGYSLAHSAGLYEGLRAQNDGKRVFTLTRSGFVGQQRYAAVTWSGDWSATWDALRRQFAAGLNLCVTGTPFWTFDIGAYFVTPGDLWFWAGDYEQGNLDLGYRELYLRWLQAGTFMPVFRSHGRCTAREPWRFGEPGEVVYDTIAAFLRLRYRLLPYLYSLNGWTTQRAYTPLRALAFDFRHDPAVYDIADQFMVGPALLVCPVTHAMDHGPDSTPLAGVAHSRLVYLPAGCDWYDFWTGERYRGGQTIVADAPLERVPLFVRSGCILPLGPEVQHTGQDPWGELEVRVYPGADGEFDLYDDAGDGYAYERGEFSLTPMRWNDVEGVLTVDERSGSFAQMPVTRTVRPVIVLPGRGIGAAPTRDTAAPLTHTGARIDWRATTTP
ncbi:MAG: glycoside hydrolase family 31 protein [Humibacillus sp.]|nr:glycoside hydrolase family 31 protein [Humibacillus sp.]MDN5775819.1 glycoside hydrolase family 31 protein [Humibacillus sp.]